MFLGHFYHLFDSINISTNVCKTTVNVFKADNLENTQSKQCSLLRSLSYKVALTQVQKSHGCVVNDTSIWEGLRCQPGHSLCVTLTSSLNSLSLRLFTTKMGTTCQDGGRG